MTFPARISQLPPFDGPFDARRLAADGCDVLFASYPAGTIVSDHAHETNNVGVITAGELILTIDGRESRHRAGDWYEVPAATVHAARFEVDTSEIELWFDR
jgi:quercetin dioxygenase-like cupin family protein